MEKLGREEKRRRRDSSEGKPQRKSKREKGKKKVERKIVFFIFFSWKGEKEEGVEAAGTKGEISQKKESERQGGFGVRGEGRKEKSIKRTFVSLVFAFPDFLKIIFHRRRAE